MSVRPMRCISPSVVRGVVVEFSQIIHIDPEELGPMIVNFEDAEDLARKLVSESPAPLPEVDDLSTAPVRRAARRASS